MLMNIVRMLLDGFFVLQANSDIGDIYQDAENMASILMHRDANGKVLVVSKWHSFFTFLSSPHPLLQTSLFRQATWLGWC